MKKVIFLFASLMLISFSASAYDNYNKPFIFLENGVEYAVFKDGQFDFNILNPVRNYGNVSINTRNINFSFNTGHSYDAYVQYDDYGAVIQIENTTIAYNYYGKVSRIGNVHLYYNNLGFVAGIGNLHIIYNNGLVTHCSGYINSYNSNNVFRPHHRYYRVPTINRCVVYNNPYRRNYIANRYDYVAFRSNYDNNRYSRPHTKRNYYRPGQHINRRVYTSRNTIRTYEPRRYNNNSTSRTYIGTTQNKTYTPRKYVDRSTRSHSNQKATSSRGYSNNRKAIASTNNGRTYKRR